MKVRLLRDGYQNNKEIYKDFLNNTIDEGKEYFSDEYVEIDPLPEFPIYLNIHSEEKRVKEYLKVFEVIEKYIINLERDITFNGTFWHSFLITKKRDYILYKYPQVNRSFNEFRNVVTKDFDWENYIYKCLIGAQYICDHIDDRDRRLHYYEMIPRNLDFYNYIIKYGITRNSTLLINIFDIVDELDLSSILKANIKGRDDLGTDERYGRRVMFEFNKSYPVIMTPMLEKDELREIFIEFLGYYYDVSEIKQRTNQLNFII